MSNGNSTFRMLPKEERPVRIVRAIKDSEHPYFVSPRSAPQDRELTWEARGLLWYLLSKPDTWEVQPSDLEQQCGRDRVYRILNELIEHRYIERQQIRNSKGRVTEVTYVVHEEPLPENPDTANPEPENPGVENTHIRYKEKERDLEIKTVAAEAADLPVKKARKRDPIYDAISEVWGTAASGFIVKIKGVLIGDNRKKDAWGQSALEVPADAAEILRFGEWAKDRMNNMRLQQLPTAPATIQKWFEDFRREGNQPQLRGGDLKTMIYRN